MECAPGKFDEMCDKNCSLNCHDAFSCSRDGHCHNGCKLGYQPPVCAEPLRQIGMQKMVIVTVLVIGFVFVMVIVVICICYVRRKKKTNKELIVKISKTNAPLSANPLLGNKASMIRKPGNAMFSNGVYNASQPLNVTDRYVLED